MSFNDETRRALARLVAACRQKLKDDVTDQLRGTFGLHPDGTILPLEQLTHLTEAQRVTAQALRELLDHFAATAAGNTQAQRRTAYERMVLEIAFTILNRLAALRLCEERGLVIECVRKGMASDGFRLFEMLARGALGTRYETYRLFLESLFDELAVDLGVLFDRTTPQSAIFLSERCLEEVLALLNDPNLSRLWTQDETIGWIYQYFNPLEERRAMREASSAPRNSRELAVRNQFFTPRYVTERPKITKSNIVCAEPMPGETDMLREFTASLTPKVLGQLVEVVFEKMKLAGEAGSLLKIEEEIRDTVAAAKKQWLEGPKYEQIVLFAQESQPKQEQLRLFDVSGVTDEEFWTAGRLF